MTHTSTRAQPIPKAAKVASAAALVLAAVHIALTAVFNVPRNEALALADPESAEGGELWQRYAVEWTAWNHVRTVAGAAASALLMAGLR